MSKNSSRAISPANVAEIGGKATRHAANQMENGMQTATDHFEKANRQFMTRMEEAASFNRNNVEAMTQACTIMAEGMKDMSQTMMASMQTAMQTAMVTGKAMMGVKTMRDLMQLQQEYMKNCFDTMMSESTRMSEMAVKCTSEAAEPISARVTDVVEKISDRAKKAA